METVEITYLKSSLVSTRTMIHGKFTMGWSPSNCVEALLKVTRCGSQGPFPTQQFQCHSSDFLYLKNVSMDTKEIIYIV